MLTNWENVDILTYVESVIEYGMHDGEQVCFLPLLSQFILQRKFFRDAYACDVNLLENVRNFHFSGRVWKFIAKELKPWNKGSGKYLRNNICLVADAYIATSVSAVGRPPPHPSLQASVG